MGSGSNNQKGFTLNELIIVLLIIAIIAVLALPQVTAMSRMWRFAGFQREVVSLLREARQEAVSQRTPITFQFDNEKKQIVIFGGKLGVLGDSKNRIRQFSSNGDFEVVYGRVSGASTAALSDGTNLTELSNQKAEILFQADGSVTDSTKNLKNNALFFYNSRTPAETAFAVSVLGAGGRAKLWRYSQTNNFYVE